MKVDPHIRKLLADIRSALASAIAESEEVSSGWKQLKAEGYSLSLVLDCQRAEYSPTSIPVTAKDPEFRINGQDLSFLQSIGIDPTRREKR